MLTRLFSAKALLCWTLAAGQWGCVSYWRGQEIDTELKALQGQVDHANETNRQAREKAGRDIGALDARIAEMERKLNAAVEGLQSGSANHMLVLEQLREQIQQLLGKQAELEHNLSNSAGDALGLAAVPGAPALPTDAADLYRYGWGKRGEGDCVEASRAFSEFASRFPNHEKADNALFLIAECQFQAKSYSASIRILQTILEKYPTGDKADDALELMHDNFIGMGRCRDALPFLEALIADYPTSSRITVAKRKLAATKKSCR